MNTKESPWSNSSFEEHYRNRLRKLHRSVMAGVQYEIGLSTLPDIKIKLACPRRKCFKSRLPLIFANRKTNVLAVVLTPVPQKLEQSQIICSLLTSLYMPDLNSTLDIIIIVRIRRDYIKHYKMSWNQVKVVSTRSRIFYHTQNLNQEVKWGELHKMRDKVAERLE